MYSAPASKAKRPSLSDSIAIRSEESLVNFPISGNKDHYVKNSDFKKYQTLQKLLKSGNDIALISDWFKVMRDLKIPQKSIAGKWGYLKSKLIQKHGKDISLLNKYDILVTQNAPL
ncbi:hypothetical protein [Thalassotalea sp. PS06]|uniref:hypothetical protein n=1 Tax=Thalassotalea sp. PS06 TaxID=2594005 RepID=UPI0011644D1A|nr:hypothetical protein [Thalassotalea sp. PS06]QDP02195.1 hypothetical protein FNC98_13100 [Thalassotalea sp. PS06]